MLNIPPSPAINNPNCVILCINYILAYLDVSAHADARGSFTHTHTVTQSANMRRTFFFEKYEHPERFVELQKHPRSSNFVFSFRSEIHQFPVSSNPLKPKNLTLEVSKAWTYVTSHTSAVVEDHSHHRWQWSPSGRSRISGCFWWKGWSVWNTKKTGLSFHCTGCLIGILVPSLKLTEHSTWNYGISKRK